MCTGRVPKRGCHQAGNRTGGVALKEGGLLDRGRGRGRGRLRRRRRARLPSTTTSTFTITSTVTSTSTFTFTKTDQYLSQVHTPHSRFVLTGFSKQGGGSSTLVRGMASSRSGFRARALESINEAEKSSGIRNACLRADGSVEKQGCILRAPGRGKGPRPHQSSQGGTDVRHRNPSLQSPHALGPGDPRRPRQGVRSRELAPPEVHRPAERAGGFAAPAFPSASPPLGCRVSSGSRPWLPTRTPRSTTAARRRTTSCECPERSMTCPASLGPSRWARSPSRFSAASSRSLLARPKSSGSSTAGGIPWGRSTSRSGTLSEAAARAQGCLPSPLLQAA